MLIPVLAREAALAAPTEPFVIQTQSAAVLIASLLSVIGAGWMILSFVLFPNLQTFRHQLLLGLAISDGVMALNFAVSSAMNVGGRWIGAPEQAKFCSFNGYLTQVFVIQTDYWVFIIAIYTYFVLTDQKRCSSWIQSHPFVPWVLPWLLSVLWASVGLGLTGYGDIGAWCWFTSDEVRLLVNFVPRWTIIAILFLLYARLYALLFRAHRHLASFDSLPGGAGRSGSNSDSRRPERVDGSGGPHAYGAFPTSQSHAHRLKRLARLMLLYPLAYALIWSLPTGIRIYQATTGQPAPWQLQTVDKVCVVAQGLVDAIIYGATEGSLSSWRNLFFARCTTRRPISTIIGVSVGDDHSGSRKGAAAAKKNRGSGYWRHAASAGEEQLTRPSTAGDGVSEGDEEATLGTSTTRRRRSAGSVFSLGSSSSNLRGGHGASALAAAAGSTVNSNSSGEGMIELGNLQKQETDPGPGRSVVPTTMRIRKTVEIEVVSNSESSGQDGQLATSYQKPPKAYLHFPRNSDSRGTFLDD